MKKLSLVLCCLFAAQFSFAKSHKVSLAKQKLDVRALSYQIVSILDARKEKHCIGLVQKGVGNRNTPAYFKEDIAKEFSGVLRPSLTRYGDRPITLRINRLFVYEQTLLSTEYGFVEMNVSFLELQGDTYVELLEMPIYREFTAMDVTPWFSKQLVSALGECLKYFNKRQSFKKTTNRVIGKSGFDTAEHQNEFPVVKNPNYDRVLYRNFVDFRDNQIILGQSFDAKYKMTETGVMTATLFKKNTKQKIMDIWGFCDGDNCFKRIGRKYFKINYEEDHLWMEGPDIYKLEDDANNALFWGGLLAYTIYLASAEGGIHNLQKYILDFETGNIIPEGEKPFETVEATTLFVCNEKSKDIYTLSTTDNVCELSYKQFHEIKSNSTVDNITACLQVGNNRICQTIEPELFRTTVYQLKMENGQPRFEKRTTGKKSQFVKQIYTPSKYKRACEN